MPARRAILLALLGAGALASAACLDPGDPVLAPLDTSSPRLVSTDPPEGGIIDRVQGIAVTFSERMDPRSLRPGLSLLQGPDRIAATVLRPADPADLPLAVQQTDEPYTVRVRGEQPLLPNTGYTLVFDPVLTDSEGNPLQAPDGGTESFALGFRTGP